MAATTRQIATYKTLAKKIHPMWNDRRYGSDLDSDAKFNDKILQLEESMWQIEKLMTDDQRQSVETWACENSLFGVLGTC